MINYRVQIRFSHLWRIIKNKLPFITTPKTKYLIGISDVSVDEFEKRLIALAYQYNYFSYTEYGQVSNMRKLYVEIVNGKEEIRQVHIRLFKNKEVYVHDELAYEYDAMAHIKAKTMKRANASSEQELVKLLDIK